MSTFASGTEDFGGDAEKKMPLCKAVTRSHCMDIADEIERFIWMIKHDKP